MEPPDGGSWYYEEPPRPTPPKRSESRGKIAVVAVVAILLVAIIAVAFVGTSDDSSESRDAGSGTTVTTVSVGDDITFSGAYADYFTYEKSTNDNGEPTVIITLKDEYASGYSTFSWYVYSDNSLVGYVIKEEACAEWTLTDMIGEYTVSVSCSNRGQYGGMPGMGGGMSFFTQTYEVTATIDGTVTKEYSFTYGGETISVSLEFGYSEYYNTYSGTNGASTMKRAAYNNGTYSVVTDFIVVDETLAGLEESLSAAYTETFSTTAEGQDYAEYLLAFVQCCFAYYEDYYTYSSSEYFAFPMETIYHGGGDCEDTSILLAALYTAAGYDAGVFVIPGHAIAAVSLDAYTAGSVASAYASSVAVFSYTTDGKTYYGCETTLDANSYGVGWISDEYSISSDGTITYEDTTYDSSYGYGLYLAKTES